MQLEISQAAAAALEHYRAKVNATREKELSAVAVVELLILEAFMSFCLPQQK